MKLNTWCTCCSVWSMFLQISREAAAAIRRHVFCPINTPLSGAHSCDSCPAREHIRLHIFTSIAKRFCLNINIADMMHLYKRLYQNLPEKIEERNLSSWPECAHTVGLSSMLTQKKTTALTQLHNSRMHVNSWSKHEHRFSWTSWLCLNAHLLLDQECGSSVRFSEELYIQV